uniref:tRNA threonylcarbamoyladenosine dehydratase n=1 Tax=Eubacterium sp. TaxID=142586 RepID=UPI004024B1FC
MLNQFSRTELLLGDAAMKKLKNSRVAVFGVGGVGGYTVEALVRSGVGALDLIDNDTVSLTNINRQIIATLDTVGRDKVDVAQERIKSINPDCVVTTHKCFYLPETAEQFDFTDYDYVVDAIDTVKGKIEIVMRAKECSTPVISSKAAGNKHDPTAIELADKSKHAVGP